ncbi:MAG TPA: DUF917 domain-containing protein [Aggregatilineales bacterium]|nr:DUF917 domain-containing protein [Aggregatilineales bacterium]
MWEVTLDDTQALALGAGVLGTGGGGNTYIGRIWLERELRLSGKGCRIVDADELADDALAVGIGSMGAPTVGVEKLDAREEYLPIVRALGQHVGKPIDALVIGEIGGANSLIPLIAGLQLGLPVVDGDGMGRAFPELQMDNFSITDISTSPFGLGDSHGNTVIFQRVDSPFRAEQYGRALTIEMGGSAALAMPTMTGRQMKASLIRGTLSLTRRLGHALLDARRRSADPAEVVARLANGRVLFRGKITDVRRETVRGFARGHLKIAGFGESGELMEIVFQNEHLIAWHNGDVVCTVPDLVSILNLDDGEPIGTEMLRYGLRVAVIGMPAPRELKTPAALRLVGPAAFGYDVPFVPMPGHLL